jgi:hypothetical protein
MMRSFQRGRFAWSLVAAALLTICSPSVARSDATATWVGTIDHVSSTQITVSHKRTGSGGQISKRFLIGDDFKGVYTSLGNKKKSLSDLHAGMSVQVTYVTAAIEHVDHATKITIMNGFNLNINLNQPTASPPASGSSSAP